MGLKSSHSAATSSAGSRIPRHVFDSVIAVKERPAKFPNVQNARMPGFLTHSEHVVEPERNGKVFAPLAPRRVPDRERDVSLLQAHWFDEAIRQAQRALALSSGLEEAKACIARARQHQGRADTETIKQLRALIDNPATDPFANAMAYALMSENSKALDALDRAYSAHSAMMPMLKTEPTFTPLRGSLIRNPGTQDAVSVEACTLPLILRRLMIDSRQ